MAAVVERLREAAVEVVSVSGDLDGDSTGRLRRALIDITHRRRGDVIVDVRDARSLGVESLSLLLNAHRRVTRGRRRLLLVCAAGPVRDRLESTGLAETFRIFPSREAARAHLRRHGRTFPRHGTSAQ
jgi:anti-anti-sigma factor